MAVVGDVDDLTTIDSTPVITGTVDVDNSIVTLDVTKAGFLDNSFSYYALGDYNIPNGTPFSITDNIIKAKDTGAVRSGNTYNINPVLIRCHNGDILCFYTSGSAHASKEDIIVSMRSTNEGVTWGSETLVIDNPTYIADNAGMRKSNVIIDPASGRIIVWYLVRGDVTADFETHELGYIYSNDHGVTWSAKTDVYADFAGYPSIFPPGSPNTDPDLIMFGKAYVTSLGLVMPMFAISNAAYLMVSADGGVTWDESDVVLVDTYSASPELNETELVQIDTEQLVMIARNDTTDTEYCYWKSSNGGATWSARSAMFTATTETKPNGSSPMTCRKIGTEIHSWFVARTDVGDTRDPKVYTTRVGADSFWDNPEIAWDTGTSYDNHRTEANGLADVHYLNIGYPDIVALPDAPYTSLIVYYDQNTSGDTDETDLHCATIATLEVP